MSRFNKISISIFTLLFVGLSIYGYTVFRDRNSVEQKAADGAEINIQSESEQNDDSIDEQTDVLDSSGDEPIEEDISTEDAENIDEFSDEIVESNNFLDVFPADCNNNCKNFQDADDLKYCQQVCGLATVKKEDQKKEGCETFNGLERDYCLKDEAVSKHEMKICDGIEDPAVKKICRNRIASYLLDSQNKQ